MSESDLVLFERWRQGRDAEAFAELVSRYADMVYATCRRVTGDAVAAEDVTQECFLKLAEGRAQVHRSVAGWLHSLATCRSLDRLRGEARRRRLEERFAGEALEPVTVAWEDLQPHIDAAIEDLPERLREVVVRHFLHGETHAEVAARLGVSRPAVSKSVARGVERIRVFLRRRGIAVSAVVLAGLVAEGVVEAAPEGVRISLGKLALSGVPEGMPVVAAAGISLTTKVVAIVGGIALAVVLYASLRPWPERVPSPAAIPPTTHHSAANEPAKSTRSDSVAPSSQVPAAREDITSTMVKTMPATAVVRGRVSEEEVLPLAGALVQVCDAGGIPSFSRKLFTATTKEDGTYEVSGIESTGKVVLRVAAEGYVDTVEGIELAEGELREGMDFNLSPGEALEGQVLSSSGAPLPGARVVPGRPRISWSTKHADPNDNIAVCNEKGIFRIGVHKGRIEGETWNLDIVAPGYGAGHFSGVTFPVGEIVPFQLQPSATIRGHISWKSGAPAEGYAVRAKGLAKNTAQGMWFTAETGCRTDAQGTYEISDLPPGLPYVAYVERPDGIPVPGVKTQTPPLPSGSIQDWSPVMTTPIRVTGRAFIEETGEPLNNYFVSACKSGVDGFSSRDFNLDGGDYELLLAEPGTHLIYPEYESAAVFEEWDTLKAYGKRVELHEGDDIRVDLFVPKAFVYPVRVTDTQGQPFPKAELQLCAVKPGGDESEAISTERKLDADGRYTWFCQPGKEVWFSAAAKGCHAETTTHRISELGVSVPEETLVLGPTAGLLAHIILPEGVTESKGIMLRVTYPDGKSEDMHTTIYFSGECQYRVPDAIRAGKVSVMAVEKDVDEPLVSQTVECTVAPGEIYDLGDLVMR